MTNHAPAPNHWPGQPQPPYGAPVPAPPKKRGKLKFVLIGLGVFVALIAIVSNTSGDKSGDQAASSGGRTAATAAAADSAAPLGTEVRDGKFGFVITGVDANVATVGDNPYLERTAQGKYVLVHVDVTNISDKPQSYFGDNQKLIDTRGREFTNDSTAELAVNQDVRFEINPGNRMSTTIAFDVPQDSQPERIEFHDSAFSGGVAAALN